MVAFTLTRERLRQYAYLIRLDKPIGFLLLLWPTLWAVWLAGRGMPSFTIVCVFVLGVILMRSAGCVLNDLADQHIDSHVERTRHRPLAIGSVTKKEAILVAGFLSLLAFLLVLLCNPLTISLAFIGMALAIIYPLLKRVTHLPQVGLGIAFSWGIPMAFAAELGMVTLPAWFLFLTSLLWPIIYDTMYAMVDRPDDLQVGVKSTAILFDMMDTLIIGLLQVLFVIMLVIVGLMFHLHAPYFISLVPVIFLFIYQQWLIKDRNRKHCFRAFLNNNWVGLSIFVGIVFSYLM